MSDVEVTTRLKAVDEMSPVLEQASANVEKSTKEMSDRAKEAHDKMVASTGEVVKGFNQLGVSAFGLIQGFDDLEKKQVAADRANLTVQKSTEAVENAQTSLSAAIRKYGSDSDQAKQASDRLSIAQQQLEINTQRANIATNQVSESHTRFALSVVPTVLSGIDGITRVQKNWAEATKEGSIISSVASTVWGVMTGQIALTTVATNIQTAAQTALNAVMDVNPVFLIVAALAALVLAFKWAYDNVEPFRNAVNSLADFLRGVFKPVIDLIVGALNWLGNAWSWLTGQTRTANEEQTKAIEAAAQAQIAAVDKKYADMAAAAEESHKKEVDEAAKKWLDQLNVEATGFDKVLQDYAKHYDKLGSEVSGALDTQLRDIGRSYQDQTKTIQDQYDEQIRATGEYYDNLIGAIDEGLNRIKGARDRDLSDLELNYLLQKKATEDAHAAGLLSDEEYQAQLDSIEKTYREARSKASDEYRLQELQYEKDHAGQIEDLEERKKDELAKIQTEQNAKLKELQDKQAAEEAAAKKTANDKMAELENERKAKLEEIRSQEKALNDKYQADLSALEQQKAAERNTILQKAESDKKAIEDTSHASSLSAMDTYRENARIRNEALRTTLMNIWNGIASAASSIWSGITNAVSNAWNFVTNLASQPIPTPNPVIPPSGVNATPQNVNPYIPPEEQGYVPPSPSPTSTPTTSTPTVTAPAQTVIRTSSGQIRDVWARGFEGVISRPTVALIGEAGPERVSVIPLGAEETISSHGTIILSPTIQITTGGINGVQDIRQLADIIYEEMCKRVRNEIKSNAFYTRGIG